MAVTLDPVKVRGVQEVLLRALEPHQNDFAPIEVLFGLVELAGRLTANHTQGTWIEAADTTQALGEHLARSVQAGLANRGNEARIITPNLNN